MSKALQAIQSMKSLADASKRSRLAVEYLARHEDGCKGGPYRWQVRAHELGSNNKEVMICAANQTGKTRTFGAETGIHATGRYPGWWRGRRWDRPVNIIVAGQTNEDLRDIQQKALFGDHGAGRTLDGTGGSRKTASARTDTANAGSPTSSTSSRCSTSAGHGRTSA